MCRLLPACEYRAIVVTPAEVVARRPGDVRQNEATLPVEVVSRLATRQFDDSKVVANTLIHDHYCPPTGMVDGVALDVAFFVNEPALDHLRSFRIDLGEAHEIAVAGVRQHEHPARRPTDLADSSGIRQEPSNGAIPLQNVRLRPTAKHLIDDRPHSVPTPILPGPIVAGGCPHGQFVGEEVELAQADISPAAGVPAKSYTSAIRVQSDALMDGPQVLGQRAEATIWLDHAQLPNLAPAPVVANEQAKICPRVGQGSVSGIGEQSRRASWTVEIEGFLVAVEVGVERERAMRLVWR